MIISFFLPSDFCPDLNSKERAACASSPSQYPKLLIQSTDPTPSCYTTALRFRCRPRLFPAEAAAGSSFRLSEDQKSLILHFFVIKSSFRRCWCPWSNCRTLSSSSLPRGRTGEPQTENVKNQYSARTHEIPRSG